MSKAYPDLIQNYDVWPNEEIDDVIALNEQLEKLEIMLKKMFTTYYSKSLNQTDSLHFDSFYYWINEDRLKVYTFMYFSALTDIIAKWEKDIYFIMKNEKHLTRYIEYNKFEEKSFKLKEENMMIYNKIVDTESKLEEILLELKNINSFEERIKNEEEPEENKNKYNMEK